jgi:hypothetical protein
MLREGHSYALVSAEPDPMADQQGYDEYCRSNSQVYAALVLNTTGVALELIGGAPQFNGHSAWQALLHKYEQPSIARGVDLHKELVSAVLGDYEDPDAYFARVEDLRRQVVGTGIPIDLLQLRCIIHANLPPTYEALIPTLNNIDISNYEAFKDTIRTHYNSQLKRHLNGGHHPGAAAQVLYSQHRRPQCSFCNRLGHVRQQCRQLQGSSRPVHWKQPTQMGAGYQRYTNKKTLICHRCGGKGHKLTDCATPQQGPETHAAMEAEDNQAGFCDVL